MTRKEEKIYPYLLAITGPLGIGVAHYFGLEVPNSASDILKQTITLSGILAGFLYSSMLMLLSLGDTSFVRRIHGMNALPPVVNYIWVSVVHWVFVALMSLIMLLSTNMAGDPVEPLERWGGVSVYLWGYLFILALASFWRSSRRVKKILINVFTPEQPSYRPPPANQAAKTERKEPSAVQ